VLITLITRHRPIKFTAISNVVKKNTFSTQFTSQSQCWSVVLAVDSWTSGLSIWSRLRINFMKPEMPGDYSPDMRRPCHSEPSLCSTACCYPCATYLTFSATWLHLARSFRYCTWIILFLTDEMNWSNCLICSLTANSLLKYNLVSWHALWHFLYQSVAVKSQFVLPQR
jgi:hypothetical protein